MEIVANKPIFRNIGPNHLFKLNPFTGRPVEFISTGDLVAEMYFYYTVLASAWASTATEVAEK